MGSTMGSGMWVEWEYRTGVEWEVLYFYPILQPILLPLFFHSTPPFYKFEFFHENAKENGKQLGGVQGDSSFYSDLGICRDIFIMLLVCVESAKVPLL